MSSYRFNCMCLQFYSLPYIIYRNSFFLNICFFMSLSFLLLGLLCVCLYDDSTFACSGVNFFSLSLGFFWKTLKDINICSCTTTVQWIFVYFIVFFYFFFFVILSFCLSFLFLLHSLTLFLCRCCFKTSFIIIRYALQCMNGSANRQQQNQRR